MRIVRYCLKASRQTFFGLQLSTTHPKNGVYDCDSGDIVRIPLSLLGHSDHSEESFTTIDIIKKWDSVKDSFQR